MFIILDVFVLKDLFVNIAGRTRSRQFSSKIIKKKKKI